eukprot:363678-Chlamydomonas_euryale.AAC.4
MCERSRSSSHTYQSPSSPHTHPCCTCCRVRWQAIHHTPRLPESARAPCPARAPRSQPPTAAARAVEGLPAGRRRQRCRRCHPRQRAQRPGRARVAKRPHQVCDRAGDQRRGIEVRHVCVGAGSGPPACIHREGVDWYGGAGPPACIHREGVDWYGGAKAAAFAHAWHETRMCKRRASTHIYVRDCACLRMSAKSGYPDIRISGADMNPTFATAQP